MNYFIITLALATLLALGKTTVSAFQNSTSNPEWLKTAVFYQIYIRSFKDSNGDGIGDIVGLTNELEYLHNLGINAIILSYMLESPQIDFGFDVSQYDRINEEYGSVSEYHNLREKANAYGIKIIFDVPIGHTSFLHDAFIRSVQKDYYFSDHYIWHSGIKNPNGGQILPPNNWVC